MKENRGKTTKNEIYKQITMSAATMNAKEWKSFYLTFSTYVCIKEGDDLRKIERNVRHEIKRYLFNNLNEEMISKNFILESDFPNQYKIRPTYIEIEITFYISPKMRKKGFKYYREWFHQLAKDIIDNTSLSEMKLQEKNEKRKIEHIY